MSQLFKICFEGTDRVIIGNVIFVNSNLNAIIPNLITS